MSSRKAAKYVFKELPDGGEGGGKGVGVASKIKAWLLAHIIQVIIVTVIVFVAIIVALVVGFVVGGRAKNDASSSFNANATGDGDNKPSTPTTTAHTTTAMPTTSFLSPTTTNDGGRSTTTTTTPTTTQKTTTTLTDSLTTTKRKTTTTPNANPTTTTQNATTTPNVSSTTTTQKTTATPTDSPTTTKQKTTTTPSASPTTTTHKPTSTQPHIVVIIGDDMGWNDVAFRNPNGSQMYTPNLDRLHMEGLNLVNSYMMPVCTPSRAAMMTGRYPFRYGMQSSVLSALDNASMPLQYTALPAQLRGLGYKAHMIGKWHLGFCNPAMTPTGRGFDSFFGMYNGMAGYFNYLSKWDGYDLHDDRGAYPNTTYRVAREWDGNYSTNVYTSQAIRVLQEHDKSLPLFLMLSYQAVHGPLEVPQGYIDNYCSVVNASQGADRQTHCGMTAAMDEGIGNVTRALDSLGYSDNLITLFISDNGGPISEGSSNWPLRGSKITLWEGGTRAVTILHSKKYLPQAFAAKNAQQWNGLMHAVDWYPTLVKAAGYQVPLTGMDGVDNWERIINNNNSNREWFVYNINDEKNNSAIRYNKYKLLRNSGGSPDAWYNPPAGIAPIDAPAGKKPAWELYDLSTDEREMTNLIADASLGSLIQLMKTKLAEYEEQIQPSIPYPSVDAGKPKFHDDAWQTGWC